MYYNGKNLEEVLQEHKEFIDNGKTEKDRDDGKYAIFDDSTLSNVRLNNGVNLSGADFSHAVLINCTFPYCDLSNTDFSCSIIYNCNFSGCSFQSANFVNAIVVDTTFHQTDFSEADFLKTIFKECNIFNANMKDVKLGCTRLYLSTTVNLVNAPEFPLACPDTGSFIGWKKCYVNTEKTVTSGIVEPVVVKLRIPETAKRISAGGIKCRCSEAFVEDIQYLDGSHCDLPAYSYNANGFIYEIGEIVRPRKKFDDNPFVECASGIHFFVSRVEAVNYRY